MVVTGHRVPTLKMKSGWEAQPITPPSAPETVDELTAQLSSILGSIAQARGDVERSERRVATAQAALVEEKACLASLEASYAEVRERLVQACRRADL